MNFILFEGIYLLKTREFVNSNQEIYKIGRSNNLSKRILNYPNKSVLHLMIECNDSILHEKNLIKIFTSKYKQKREYGKEYFSGVLNEMKDDIINYLNPIMNNKQYKMIIDTIIIDRQTFIDDKTLFRHQMDLAQCIVHYPTGTITNKIKTDKILQLEYKLNKIVEQNLTKPNVLIFNTINDIDNNDNVDNIININNNIDNNIPIVYPFGYENIYFLSDNEMIEILTSNNCLINAMHKIYSNDENKNFMKRNVKVDTVTVIDKSCNIRVIFDDMFKRQILKQTFDSLKLMFNHCKNKLNIEYQIMLWQNLRILDKSIQKNIKLQNINQMDNEIQEIMDIIKSMIFQENESIKSKKHFNAIKKSLVNKDFKRVFDEKLNHIVSKMQEFRDNYNNRSIDFDLLIKNIWMRNLNNDPKFNITPPDNHIKAHDVIDTPRYKFIEEMAKLENEYLATEERNTTGNIDSVCDIRERMLRKNIMHTLINMI